MNGNIEQEAQAAAKALERGDFEGAARIADAILARHADEPNALLIKAMIDIRRNDFAAARDHLRRAVTKHPEHIHALNNLGIVERRLGDVDAAMAAFSRAIDIFPAFGAAHRNRGNLFSELGERNLAIDSFQAAHIADPKSPEPLASLASVALSLHKPDDAKAFAVMALERQPTHLSAGLVHARSDLMLGDLASARVRAEELSRRAGISGRNRAHVFGLLGQILDAQGKWDEAFPAFEAANAALVPLAMHMNNPESELAPERLKALAAELDRPYPTLPRPAENNDLPPDPVFLVGFPRSGTTLLDQILASHPDVATLEEVDNLGAVTADILKVPGAYARIAALSGDDIAERRARYWARVRSARGFDSSRRVFIDKLPMNISLLAGAAALFPEARIIFALRDPRDAVLSCFQQTFELTAATINFLSLTTTAQLYDATMTLMKVEEMRLPIGIKRVRYEDVTTKFDRSIADLLGFLGLPWSENVRNYADTARRRPIGTPSAPQVVRDLYTTSTGKWRHYARHMREVRPLLEPWAGAFGYAVD